MYIQSLFDNFSSEVRTNYIIGKPQLLNTVCYHLKLKMSVAHLCQKLMHFECLCVILGCSTNCLKVWSLCVPWSFREPNALIRTNNFRQRECKTLMLPTPSSTSSKNALKTIWEKFCHPNIINKITAIITLEYCIRDTISNSIFLQFLPWIKRIWIGLWCACIVLCKNIWLLVNEFFLRFSIAFIQNFWWNFFSIIWLKLHEHFPDKNVQGWLCVFLTG